MEGTTGTYCSDVPGPRAPYVAGGSPWVAGVAEGVSQFVACRLSQTVNRRCEVDDYAAGENATVRSSAGAPRRPWPE
jgi:hypothetical protein